METGRASGASQDLGTDTGNTTISQSLGQSSGIGIDYNHPLFLSPSDVSGIQIISFQLTGIENFSIWFRSMRIALLGRNKLGLVDGSCSKDKFPESMWNHWERVNAIVLSWLMNSVAKHLLGGVMYASVAQVVWQDLFERFNKVDGSRTYNLNKEIATLTQGTDSVSVYFSRLKNLWEEFEALVPAPGCDCEKSRSFVLHLQKLKLFQFLMGLNDSYGQARGHILIMSPLPSVNQAYALVVSDEGQKSIVSTAGVLGANPSAGMSSFDMAMYSRNINNNSQRFKKTHNVICDFCKCRGHVKENCYKLIGYPPDFKSKKKVVLNGLNNNGAAYNVIGDSAYERYAAKGNRNESCGTDLAVRFGYGHESGGIPMGSQSSIGENSKSQMSVPQMNQMGGNMFSKEQYDQIVKLLSQTNTNPSTTVSANVAGSLHWEGEGDW